MDVREKLVELIESARYWGCGTSEEIAKNLIAHGVTVQDNTQITDELLEQLRNTPVTILQEEPTIETVQEWISVKDRLPTAEDALPDGSVYAYTKAKKVLVLHYQYVCRRSDYILCWMPIAMPQPPNEVEQ